jgi:hypothetical protein
MSSLSRMKMIVQISEVWHITDDGKSRKVMIRPGRMRKPMKTRMFDATTTTEFTLKYKQSDEDSGEHSLADFIQTWEENNHAKITVPK